MAPETPLARIIHAVALGTVAGLSLALCDFLLVPVAAGGTAWNSAFTLGLTLLVGLGVVAGLAATLPKHLILLSLAGVGYWLGHELTRGAFAQTLPAAALWKYILAAALPGSAAFIASRQDRRVVLMVAAACISLTLGVAFVERGHYMGIRAALLPIVFAAAMFAARPWVRSISAARCSQIACGGGICLIFSVALALPTQSVVDATETSASLNVAPMLLLRGLLPHDAVATDDIDLMDRAFFGTPLAAESLSHFDPINGVLLITIDALRPNLPGRTIGGKAVTPTLDGLAKSGMAFSRNYATCTSSHLSLLSLFSGALPAAIDSQAGKGDAVPLITRQLEEAGVETRSCFPLAVHTVRNRDRPFTDEDLGFGTATRHKLDDPDDADIIRAILPQTKGRFFSYCHIMRPHKPYGDCEARFHAGDSPFEKYAADVRSADATVARILAAFEKQGLLAHMLVIITADHGEEFGEHGGATHGNHLFDETARVPMIVVGPGVENGTQHDGITSLIDVATTLDHLFRNPSEPTHHRAGRSLLPILAGLPDPHRVNMAFGEILPVLSFAAESLTMVVEGQWKLLIDQATHRNYLFDLQNDPIEKQNVFEENPKIASRLAGLMEARRRADNSTASAIRDVRIDAVQTLEAQVLEETVALFTTKAEQLNDLLAFSLAYLASDLTQAQAKLVSEAVTPAMARDSSVRAALIAVRIGAGIEEANEQAELEGLLATESDPFIQVAVYRAFRRARKDELLSVKLPTPSRHGDVVRLARMAYRMEVAKEPLAPSSVRTALHHKNPWVRRLALECVTSSAEKAYLEDLRRSSIFFHEKRYREALDQTHIAIKKGR